MKLIATIKIVADATSFAAELLVLPIAEITLGSVSIVDMSSQFPHIFLHLRPSFVNEVEGGFSRPPEAFEATSRHHFTHAFFPCLRTQGQPYFLRE